MVNKEQTSLTEMLLESKLPELPSVNDPNRIWVLAIVKIVRATGAEDYVLAEHDMFSWEEIKVRKEMGGVGIPRAVKAIYPYEYLNSMDMPRVETKQDIIHFLAKCTNDDAEYLSGVKDDVLRNMFLNICIKESIKKFNQKSSVSDYILGLKDTDENKLIMPEKSSAIEFNEEDKILEDNPKVIEEPIITTGEEPKKSNRGRKPKMQENEE